MCGLSRQGYAYGYGSGVSGYVERVLVMNTLWIVQGLDEEQDWETILVSDTWAGLLGLFKRLEHKSNWSEFRTVTAEIAK
jgi:hypothetical protein